MTKVEKAQVRKWIRTWDTAEPILEDLRLKSLRRVDTAAAIESLDLAYKSARLLSPPRLSSGLVEQQRWFKKGMEQLRRKKPRPGSGR